MEKWAAFDGSTSLYDPALLEKLDFRKSPAKFRPEITAVSPGEPWLKVRPLQIDDYKRGFIELLSQLTSTGNITQEMFIKRFFEMKRRGDYLVTVIEDTRINKLIGSATLVLEYKFIHDCGIRGHLEDVVVNDTYRGKQLGKLIVVTINMLAHLMGCYKISLECKDSLIPFYTSLGYLAEAGNSNSMHMRYAATAQPITNGDMKLHNLSS